MSGGYGFFSFDAARDRRLGETDLRVLAVLGVWASNTKHECCPSQSTIGKELGIAREVVNRSIRQLEACGHITISRSVNERGVKQPNTYTLILNKRSWGGSDSAVTMGSDTGATMGSDSAVTGVVTQPSHKLYLENSTKDNTPSKPVPSTRRHEYGADFEALWSAYPKNGASKFEAGTSYAKAIKGGASPEEILTGAQRYARHVEMTGTFVANATTWLNNKRWSVDYVSTPPAARTFGRPIEKKSNVQTL